MTNRDLVRRLQIALNIQHGTDLVIDGEWGPRTAAAAAEFDIEITAKRRSAPAPAAPGHATWLDAAKKHSGAVETNSKFNAYLSGFWKIVGLPGYKTIVGTSFAWCGLFVAAMLYEVDLPWQKDGAGARNWAKYGVAVDWQRNGIPRGAIVHINHNGCTGGSSGNHVGFANGSCAPADLKSGSFNMYGGNQGNAAKVSAFPVKNICAVRWPPGVAVPAPVTASKGCKGTATGESTR